MDKIYTEAGFNPDEPLLIPMSELSLCPIDLLYELKMSPINRSRIHSDIYRICKYGPMKTIEEFNFCIGYIYTNYQLQEIVYRLFKAVPNIISYEDMTNVIWAINGIGHDTSRCGFEFYEYAHEQDNIKLLEIAIHYDHSDIIKDEDNTNYCGWKAGGKFIDSYSKQNVCIEGLSNTKIVTSYLSGQLRIKYLFFHFLRKYGACSGLHRILQLGIKIHWNEVHEYDNMGYIFEGLENYWNRKDPWHSLEELVMLMLSVSADTNDSRTDLAILVASCPMHVNTLKGLIAVIDPIKDDAFMDNIIRSLDVEKIQEYGFDDKIISNYINRDRYYWGGCSNDVEYLLKSDIEIDWSKCKIRFREGDINMAIIFIKRVIRGPKVPHNAYNGKNVKFCLIDHDMMKCWVDEIYFAGALTVRSSGPMFVQLGEDLPEQPIVWPISTRAKKYHKRFEPYKFAKRLYDIIARFD